MDKNDQEKLALRPVNGQLDEGDVSQLNVESRPVPGMKVEDSGFWKKNSFVLLLIVVPLMVISIIITSLNIKVTKPRKIQSECTELEYTKCANVDDHQKTCYDTLNDKVKTCTCDVTLNLDQDLIGNVTLYYKLTSYDQTDSSYSRSRDDKQLSGYMSRNVSQACGDYAYSANEKPIAPCGLVADTMFTDSYKILFNNEELQVVTPTGLVDKTGFENPPGNLTEVFQDYAKPINWVKNVWELDPTNPHNNGFQYEPFIAWMQADLKRKPAWRLKPEGTFKDGLPSGSYVISMDYQYPLTRYNGRRVVWICAEEDCEDLDYTDCRDVDNQRRTCYESLAYDDKDSCRCYNQLNVSHNLTGDIILKYELVSYDQTSYATSRDDDQLSGKLSSTVSQKCGEYSYNNGTPIAPCGFMADSMFNDSYILYYDGKPLNVETTGLVDKSGYKNPPPADLSKAFKDFDKPKNWAKNIWELDLENPDNNGFQNEAFIAWMRTDLKTKPVWRLNLTGRYKDGLPKGTYNIQVTYAYPVSRYNGSRIIMVCGETTVDVVKDNPGVIVLLSILVIALIAVAYFSVTYRTIIFDSAKLVISTLFGNSQKSQ